MLTQTITEPRLEDFGEHIPGARKDLAARHLETGMADDPSFKDGLSKSWPKPDWQALAETHREAGRPAEVLACSRGIRDILRTAAGRRYEQRHQRHEPPHQLTLRGVAADILEGRTTATEAAALVKSVKNELGKSVENRTEMYLAAGHAHDLGDYYVYRSHPSWVIGAARHYYMKPIGKGATITEAAAKLVNEIEKQAAKSGETEKAPRRRKNPFTARFHTTADGETSYGIYRQVAGRKILVRRYDTSEAAVDGLTADREALEAWWEAWRHVPNERNPSNAPRTPAGTDGTGNPDQFNALFALRGVQFGNWVENARRRADLVEASQALIDLSRVLGWQSSDLSIGGRLGLAFGARGSGGKNAPAAHYEPAQAVMNLTKTAGAGSLAHEWFHAFDHHAAILAGGGALSFATRGWTARRNAATQHPSPEHDRSMHLCERLRSFGHELDRSPMAKRAKILDRRRPKSKPYWATTIELAARAFEVWVAQQLGGWGIRNDYLVNYRKHAEWEGKIELGQPYPYPLPSEMFDIDRRLAEIADIGCQIAESLPAA